MSPHQIYSLASRCLDLRMILCIVFLLNACESSTSSSSMLREEVPDLGTTERERTDQSLVDQEVDPSDLSIWMNEDQGEVDQEIEPLNDMGSVDANLPSVMVDLNFTAPQEEMSVQVGSQIDINAHINIVGTTLEFVALDLKLNENISIPFTVDQATQTLSAQWTAPTQPGTHTLTLSARIFPSYEVQATRTFLVNCESVHSFDTPLNEQRWMSFGPAVHDSRGWLELTQNQLNTKGGIFWIGETLEAGYLDIEFDFSTSKCMEPGPCSVNRINAGGGFAVNFWNIPPSQVENYWAATRGLGNTTPLLALQEAMLPRPESFHVAFDTYSNSCMRCGTQGEYDGCGNRHYEPTHLNHVSILTNGHQAIHGDPDEMGSYCHLGIPDETWEPYWAAFPNMDDGEWHHVHLTIQGTQVELDIDDQSLISSQFPNFGFKGGILSFSAGSGVNGNFHRVDNLRVNQFCQE